ncbi:excinuclease ATPase subunit [Companilactobacillus paralimentarius DSM 13238 = JCM 10415]|mgnify:CR=1 FL=1|uniref:UvrABC system protein A n=1 Tax=Companilactobacillus paralimentarius DSM 13238 = JCM 10415 TaxID=1122151 RepID=A0A0R1PGS7_9LACO|nr:excinuclease ABC subunit UvrA [Companilactobacillus paralimentarius]KAE9565119.1 excinuclease ABC subunit A [Companilactobacillus paralimentarius]KRL31613.1 excinuclease ATPase subunit [Companilactobacillus paralimentarius DSM 13238 = JCM 10415]MDR4932783.1 excinuclease ABC subunit UvrA [Companilactobacillus paralimentarius]
MTIRHKNYIPDNIEVIGANANNLKNINVDIPLNSFVAITGVSGSGKSSLAMDTIYAEGARKYLNALSTYTRRRITQMGRSDVKNIKNLPSTIALRQRPVVPSVRSTVGTMTESLNILRLMFSRLASVVCPNGHRLDPTLKISEVMDLPTSDEDMGMMTCPVCQAKFMAFSAEDFSFNSDGACPTCQGTGFLKEIELDKIIPDQSLSIDEGAIRSWNLPGRTLQKDIIKELGVRTDVPFKDLTAKEKDIVINGKEQKKEILVPTKTGRSFRLNALYENAITAVKNSLKSTKNENTLTRLERFYTEKTCPDCHGSRFNPKLFTNELVGKNIAEVSQFTISQLQDFCQEIMDWLPDDMKSLGKNLTNELLDLLSPIVDLGLNYLSISRAGNTLSTGELQRIQLARTIRNQMTGVLYVLDEPSVGLHAANVAGLIKILRELVRLGNSLIVVDHDTSIIAAADYVIEIGPDSGADGGRVITQGTVEEIEHHPDSVIQPYLTGKADIIKHQPTEVFKKGTISIQIGDRYNIHDMTAKFSKESLNIVSGMSGSGKTTLIFESLLPALQDKIDGEQLPKFVKSIDNADIKNIVKVDSVPIGKNVRSTVGTYTKILDHLRKIFAQTSEAKAKKFTPTYFSYNNKQGACPNCGGTGVITLDIQYLPDMVQTCPVCHGNRYKKEILDIMWHGKNIAEILDMSVKQADKFFQDVPQIKNTLDVLINIGLSYLKLGESTPTLSGGEAQRMKLVTYMKRSQKNQLFVFDEPSVGLHPKDVGVLLDVFNKLLKRHATIIVIEHDLDIISNADYINDLGPEGGVNGGKIIATGTPKTVANNSASLTGKYLKEHLKLFNQD